MGEASLEVPVVEEVSADVRRREEGLRYHKKGHDFYKTRYYQSKTRLNRTRLIAVVVTVLALLLATKVASLNQDNSALETRVTSLERALYEK
ncbi:MAG: hypothetical protein GKR90_14945 [Pseudomonadales bacterium]|nr:hypothetical protein [Pseudomonadales bacterium]